MKGISVEIPDYRLYNAKVQKCNLYLLNGKHAISCNKLR